MASKHEVPGLTTQVKRHQSHQVWKKGLVRYCTLQVIARQRNRKHSARCIARHQRIESSRNNVTAITTQHPKPAAVGNRGAPVVIAGPCRSLQGRQLVQLHAAVLPCITRKLFQNCRSQLCSTAESHTSEAENNAINAVRCALISPV